MTYNQDKGDLLEQYIIDHIDPEGPYLHQLFRATNIHLLYGRMASGHMQGRLLKMLVTMIRPHRILEIGTYSGYSALCMAEGMDGDALLHTIEVNDEQEDFTRPWIEGSAYAERIRFHIGDAIDVIPQLDERFDMVFMDADKRHYSDYYRMVMDYLNPGGYIIADNTLWDGHVVEPEHQHDPQTLGIMAFNDMVAADKRVEKVIIPIRDGLSIIRKK